MLTQRTGTALLESNAQPTLKERIKEAWETKSPIMESAKNPETMNYTAMGCYWMSLFVLFTSSIFYVIPSICSEDDLTHIELFLKLLVCLSHGACNVNWFLCAERKTQFVKPTTIIKEEQDKLAASSCLPLGYRYCDICQLYSPPRAFHCKMCHSCVLKRDYHCYVTGSCVGFTSQRRYLPWLFHVSFGAAIHMLICVYYIQINLPFMQEYVTYVPFVAIARCWMGELDTVVFFFLMQMYACMAVMVVAACYFSWEWLMVIRGQTSYEASRSIQTYRIGMSRNIHMVFGPMWILNFIFPIPSTIPGDGVHWDRRSNQKGF